MLYDLDDQLKQIQDEIMYLRDDIAASRQTNMEYSFRQLKRKFQLLEALVRTFGLPILGNTHE